MQPMLPPSGQPSDRSVGPAGPPGCLICLPCAQLTLAHGRLRVGLLVVQALAVHRNATITVELLSLWRGRLVGRPTVCPLLVLLTAVPPGARAHHEPVRVMLTSPKALSVLIGVRGGRASGVP